jgi:hypothetical protein
MFVVCNTNALFGSATVGLNTPVERKFNSRDIASNRRYIEAKFKYLMEHQWFQSLEGHKLDLNPNHRTTEGLDRDWLQASKYAANKVKRNRIAHSPRSLALPGRKIMYSSVL